MTPPPEPAVLGILVIDDDQERATIVEHGLTGSGYRVLARVATGSDLTAVVRTLKPDVILIDTDAPDRDTLEHMRSVGRDAPRPIVMFVDRSDAAMTQQALEAGVSAYVVAGLNAHSVRPVIDVAIARFREVQTLRAELARTRAELAGRKQIDRAKGLLMQQRGWTEEQAYHSMRKMAMEDGIKLADVAGSIIMAARLVKD
jgi:response regulator NasT